MNIKFSLFYILKCMLVINMISIFHMQEFYCTARLSGLLHSNKQQFKLNLDGKNKLQTKKIPVFLGILPSYQNNNTFIAKDDNILLMSNIIKKCLEHTNQFDINIKTFNKPTFNRKDIKKLLNDGYVWVIFINNNLCTKASKSSYEWRIYDPTESSMVAGKKVESKGNVKDSAYKISNQIWNELMQSPNCFESKIAYIQRSKNDLLNHCSIIYTCDYDGSNIEKVLDNNRVYAGLYWNQNSKNPTLLCSEFTKFNVRLVSFKLNNLSKNVIFNIDGTCVGISLAKDTQQAIYCRSGDIWHYGYNNKYKKAIHTRVIKNEGKNTNPILLPNGDIIFCSNAVSLSKKKVKIPKIYYYNKDTKKIDSIVTKGYSVSPCYSSLKDQIIYSCKVNNVFQLFSYDLKTKVNKQITFDKGNKVDACYSPCANYIVFCYQCNSKSQIAIMNLQSKKKWFITKSRYDCSYPTWSNNLDVN